MCAVGREKKKQGIKIIQRNNWGGEKLRGSIVLRTLKGTFVRGLWHWQLCWVSSGQLTYLNFILEEKGAGKYSWGFK